MFDVWLGQGCEQGSEWVDLCGLITVLGGQCEGVLLLSEADGEPSAMPADGTVITSQSPSVIDSVCW